MSVLVVGMSHKTGPVDVLERLSLDDDGAQKLVADLVATEHVTEAVVISTCNRVETYVQVDRFHGSVEDVSRLLAERAGANTADVVPHLFVHYDEAAVAHLFSVAAGLDSMVIGESQILGQVRSALRQAQDLGSVGPALNVLFQQALRVGKRGHAETDIDRTGPSVVAAALDQVEATAGSIEGRRALVVGAGAMASLAVAGLDGRGVADVMVVNRTQERAQLAPGPAGRGRRRGVVHRCDRGRHRPAGRGRCAAQSWHGRPRRRPAVRVGGSRDAARRRAECRGPAGRRPGRNRHPRTHPRRHSDRGRCRAGTRDRRR